MDEPRGEPNDAGDTPWLTLSEAAARSGRHIGALRSLIRRRRILARKGNGGQWLVQLRDDPMAEPDAASGSPNGSTGSARGLASGDAMAELTAEVAELREQLARAEVEREAARAVATAEMTAAKTSAAAEVKAARDTAAAEVAAKDAVIADLREELAWHRRPWRRRWRG
jgi:hypothetical protein